MTTNALYNLINFGRYLVHFVPKVSSAIKKNQKIANRTKIFVNTQNILEREKVGFVDSQSLDFDFFPN